jgi:hypothetical protein
MVESKDARRAPRWLNSVSLDLITMRTLRITTLALLANIAFAFSSYATPFETLPDGRIRHTVSGFVFPKRMGVFQREKTQQYNQAGSDVSAGYNAGVLIAATVYVYPAPGQPGADGLLREYASKRAEVLQGHQGATALSEGATTVSQGGRKYSGKRAYFSYRDIFAGIPQNVKSQLLVFRADSIFIEYRFSYPGDHAEQAEKEIDRFIREWSWR